MSYVDHMILPRGQDPRKGVPPSGQFHPYRPPPGARQNSSWCCSHWHRFRIFFLFNIPPELGASDLDSFPLILLSGFGYCKGDRGKFLGRSPIFPLFWKVRLKVIRNHFHPPPGDVPTQHILCWPQEVSAPRPDSVSCPYSMKATWITFWNDQSRFPWVYFWRSKTTADYFFSLY